MGLLCCERLGWVDCSDCVIAGLFCGCCGLIRFACLVDVGLFCGC